MKIDWQEIREQEFPALKTGVHLKSAGGSPLSKSAYQEGINYFNGMLNSGDVYWDEYFEDLDSTRKLIARYINAKPEEIVFLINTSSCMNVVARLIKKGEILYPQGEFPASIHIFKRLGFNCKRIKHEGHRYLIDEFRKEKSTESAHVIHSHVQYLTGFRQDLEELGKFCKECHLTNMINATQSFGVFPIDIQKFNIDILVASALKWACCGYGIGILYIKQDLIKEQDLPFSGWLSVENYFSMDNDNLKVVKKPRSMDSLGGTPNFPALLTLKGGLNLITKIGNGNIQKGVQEIQKRIEWLTSEFIKEAQENNLKIITPLEDKHRSGIITIEHDNSVGVYGALLKNDIFISLRNYPKSSKKSLLRFAFNYYNNLEDIKATINVLKGL